MRAIPHFEFSVPVYVKKRRKWYLVVCPPLDIASQGPTLAKAMANIKDAVLGFVADCYERGVLDEVLKQAGFIPGTPPAGLRITPSATAHTIQVPFYLLGRERHSAETRQR